MPYEENDDVPLLENEEEPSAESVIEREIEDEVDVEIQRVSQIKSDSPTDQGSKYFGKTENFDL